MRIYIYIFIYLYIFTYIESIRSLDKLQVRGNIKSTHNIDIIAQDMVIFIVFVKIYVKILEMYWDIEHQKVKKIKKKQRRKEEETQTNKTYIQINF